MSEDFYWRVPRDSLITNSALQMFQLLYQRKGSIFDEVKADIDKDYSTLTGKEYKKHGGLIQTWVKVFQEAGWVALIPNKDGKELIEITPAGEQGYQILIKLPDFHKAAPYFVIELLSRAQLNNPAKPKLTKDTEYEEKLSSSDIFPYWTLFKIIIELEDYITADELKRFVFKLHSSSEIDNAIETIRAYRIDKHKGLSKSELDTKYSAELEGAKSEPKYYMGRLGTQVGKYPAVLEKEGTQKWVLNKYYKPTILEILKEEKSFKLFESIIDWTQHIGKPVDLDGESQNNLDREDDPEPELIPPEIDSSDKIFQQFKELIDSGSRNFILSGPPGTGKSWYARQVALLLSSGKTKYIESTQFHPNFGYDEFVEGYVPSFDENQKSNGFEIRPKVFLKTCSRAKREPDKLFIIVIDEFTRGDPSRILGEVLTYIEPDYRDKYFRLAYSQRKEQIPKNLIIIATMNPYDKSVSDLDDALERRFESILMNPDREVLKSLLERNGMEPALQGRVINFYNKANKSSPHGLGHALFSKVSNQSDLRRLWKHKLERIFEKMFRFEMEKYNELNQLYNETVLNE
ncbi:AlwI family type II restriction endonuclease [Idiomarina sp. M1R2S28]|uniref:AlwI family type II restriction endonuclease n=1 Tax=Idiomarina rhizosphaerae TaxID=2961572 RepID=A0A9X2JRI5_9GAMM|nr:AlwI family type II restriction endonuclease [Idiomarina rhizosphaerae]MCP1339402.1 AlwI family type II restriction endonuclease [Idiomarina rhizosphaerae]